MPREPGVGRRLPRYPSLEQSGTAALQDLVGRRSLQRWFRAAEGSAGSRRQKAQGPPSAACGQPEALARGSADAAACAARTVASGAIGEFRLNMSGTQPSVPVGAGIEKRRPSTRLIMCSELHRPQ